ncbi:MAG: response regulator, partial [Caldilineaceae bacterium]|nr:response regulator [Caldilineaceae bacterium]
MVVDDERILRDLLERSLVRAGYRVHVASNGHEALAIFAECPIHLVLADGRMPGMDGFELCEALRQQSDLPIIMITSLDNPDEVIHGFMAGADDYITKPFQFRDVETRIASL